MFLTATFRTLLLQAQTTMKQSFMRILNSSSNIHLTVTMEKPAVDYPFSWLGRLSQNAVRRQFSHNNANYVEIRANSKHKKTRLQRFASLLGKVGRKRLLVLLLVSLVVWFRC